MININSTRINNSHVCPCVLFQMIIAGFLRYYYNQGLGPGSFKTKLEKADKQYYTTEDVVR